MCFETFQDLSSKVISGQMKSKGPWMLNWYWQMCQKQCQDETSFKCPSLTRNQMLLASENPDKVMHYLPNEFQKDFLHPGGLVHPVHQQ